MKHESQQVLLENWRTQSTFRGGQNFCTMIFRKFHNAMQGKKFNLMLFNANINANFRNALRLQNGNLQKFVYFKIKSISNTLISIETSFKQIHKTVVRPSNSLAKNPNSVKNLALLHDCFSQPFVFFKKKQNLTVISFSLTPTLRRPLFCLYFLHSLVI